MDTNFRKILDNKAVDAILALTASSFTAGAWGGVSDLIGEYPVDESIGSFVFTRLPEEASDYIIAVRGFVEDGVSRRFKLYSNGYEVLHYPVYNGELIPYPAVIEIWTHEQTPVGTIEVPETTMLIGSLTKDEIDIPTQPTYTLTSRAGTVPANDPCNPFCSTLCYP